jgi:hypothetical protein
LLLCIGLALSTVLWTDWGRDQVRGLVVKTITNEIAGRLEVDGFDELSLSHVRAHGIRIFAPDDKLAISAETADIEFDLMAIFRGTPGWERAEIHDGKVFVTENPQGKINMEETFRSRSELGKGPEAEKTESEKTESEKPNDAEGESRLDLRNMVTSDAQLVISGGSLPSLRLVNLYGIMRVHVLGDGKVELRFDEYRGFFERGLPTGTLRFRDVAGQVVPSHKRLLHFEGRGKTEGTPVAFSLDIFTKPKKVKIDAHFAELSPGALPTLGVAAWSKFSPSLDVSVRTGK